MCPQDSYTPVMTGRPPAEKPGHGAEDCSAKEGHGGDAGAEAFRVGGTRSPWLSHGAHAMSVWGSTGTINAIGPHAMSKIMHLLRKQRDVL